MRTRSPEDLRIIQLKKEETLRKREKAKQEADLRKSTILIVVRLGGVMTMRQIGEVLDIKRLDSEEKVTTEWGQLCDDVSDLRRVGGNWDNKARAASFLKANPDYDQKFPKLEIAMIRDEAVVARLGEQVAYYLPEIEGNLIGSGRLSANLRKYDAGILFAAARDEGRIIDVVRGRITRCEPADAKKNLWG